jgi:hypothetical protein
MPLARAAHASKEGAAALAAVEALSNEDASDLLEDALDMWAAGGAPPDIRIVTPQDLGLDDDELPAPCYGVYPGTVNMPDGRPLPSMMLEPETAGAGFADLLARTDWQPWDMRTLPDLNFNWRLRVDIATRSLTSLVHVDAEGYDDVVLWRASETVALPEQWWDLLDRAQHILVTGPSNGDFSSQQQTAAADAGKLLAVVARVGFL